MILTMDIGNSNIKVALFNGMKLVKYWRLATNYKSTSDQYGIQIVNLFEHSKIPMKYVKGIIISSVAPTINFTIEHMCTNYFNMQPVFVVPGMKTGINLKYENPKELGSDRIANAVAAYNLYGSPCIYIDFGTATTFGAIDAKGNFAGGCICTGIKLSSDALVMGTAKLPHYELIKPETVICKTTVSNLQSGLIYGLIGEVKYLIERFKEELNAPDAFVVATGGFARLISDDVKEINKLDGLLTLKGLCMLYEKNTK